MFSTAFLIALATISIVGTSLLVDGHVIWTYPSPRQLNTTTKSFPCGDDDGSNSWGLGPVTNLKVGMNEVVFNEFVCHSGDMVRIALSMNNEEGFDDHVLLDRLPHNEMCNTRQAPNLMAVNITVPDVDCVNNECSLQIIQVMSSKFKGSACSNPSGISQYCGTFGHMYYSCARVRIDGRLPEIPPIFNDFYGATAPVDYEWPLVADWCRDNNEPSRICGETKQAVLADPTLSLTTSSTTDEPTTGAPATDQMTSPAVSPPEDGGSLQRTIEPTEESSGLVHCSTVFMMTLLGFFVALT